MFRVFGYIAVTFLTLLCGFSATVASAEITMDAPVVYLFARDDCKFCKAEEAFLESLKNTGVAFILVRYDVGDVPEHHELFVQLAEAKQVPKVTPITIVGGTGIQGYAGDEITGAALHSLLIAAPPHIPIEVFIASSTATISVMGSGCDASSCGTTLTGGMVFPIVGAIDPLTAPLSGLSFVLGVIDGFNPCAMWVLVTFLMFLANVGSRKRMVAVAGLFILAEAIMYALILNVWHATFDFVALDRMVTPLVGILAVGSGLFFVYRFYRMRTQTTLVCDVTTDAQQSRLVSKMERIATMPLSIIGALAIIGIAFSVNVIEFACSVGIPQAFAKLLELNGLSVIGRQWYIAVYTFGYMVDDLVVFAGAVWGITRLRNTALFTKWSALAGGILMILLGSLLLFSPDWLVW
jgi:thiol-disulfide isomerase/thioredoxin